MKKILITGAYGFVGTNLVQALKNKYELWALDIKPANDHYTKFYDWDHLSEIPFDEVDTVIHLAGKAHDTKGLSEAQVYFDINTGLTKRVFDAFLASKAKKFILFSSVKAAADFVDGDILTENIVPRPIGAYGESKIKAEEYLLSKETEYGDKKVYIFRPSMIHGPGNKGNLNLLYNFISKGVPYPLGAFENQRSFTSIGNLIFLIDNLLQVDASSGIYNVSDDEPLSTNRLIEAMCEALDKEPKIWNLPKGLISTFAKIGDIIHLPLNTFRLDKLTENYVVSNVKIKKAINVDELPIKSYDGVVSTIKSFKTN